MGHLLPPGPSTRAVTSWRVGVEVPSIPSCSSSSSAPPPFPVPYQNPHPTVAGGLLHGSHASSWHVWRPFVLDGLFQNVYGEQTWMRECLPLEEGKSVYCLG